MKIRILIALIPLFSYLISTPAVWARIFLATDATAEQISPPPRPFKWHWSSIVVAQSKPQSTEGGHRSSKENGKQAQASEADDEEKSGLKTDEPDTKPVKPFRPSEEIAAEQAVDYPVDI